MGFMAGKRALIVGVASERSIAAGIAEAFAREGAEIAFTYQNEKLLSRVEKLAIRLGQNTDLLFPCDVSSDEEIDAQLTRVMSLIEPLMLIFMALVVGMMLLSVYYPLLQAYGQSSA